MENDWTLKYIGDTYEASHRHYTTSQIKQIEDYYVKMKHLKPKPIDISKGIVYDKL